MYQDAAGLSAGWESVCWPLPLSGACLVREDSLLHLMPVICVGINRWLPVSHDENKYLSKVLHMSAQSSTFVLGLRLWPDSSHIKLFSMLSHAFITTYELLQKQTSRIPASTADFRPYQMGGISRSAKMITNGFIESIYIFPDGSEVSVCVDNEGNLIGGYKDLGRMAVKFDSPVLGQYINLYDIAASRTSALKVLIAALDQINVDRLSARDMDTLISILKREWDAQ